MQKTLDNLFAEMQSAWRFRWPAVLAAWIVCVLGWVGVFLIPGRYDTTARVYVDTNSLLRPLLEGLAVTPNTVNEVEMVRRALLGRPQLEKVIDGTGLSARVHSERERSDLFNELIAEIRLTGDTQSRLYTITYGDHDPKISYEVVRALLGLFVGESVDGKRANAENARNFLLNQIGEYEQRLIDSEGKLAAFKKNNVGYMPDDRGGYFERLQREMQETDRLSADLSVAENKRNELRAKLLGTGSGGAPDPSIAAVETSVDARIVEARRRLGDLLLQYTESHPDVIALTESISSLEAQRRQELEMLRSSGGALGAARSSQSSPVLQNLQMSLNGVEVEITSLRSQIADHRGRIAELRKNMNVLPEVEAELARLNRDYGVNRAQYDALVQRLESARLTDAADRSDDLKFKIIDPPVLPLSPAAPNRALLLLGVLLGGIGAGGALAWLLAKTRPVFSSPAQLRLAFKDLKVFGAISMVGAEHEASKSFGYRVKGNALFAVAMGALVFVFIVVFSLQDRVEQWGRLVSAGG